MTEIAEGIDADDQADSDHAGDDAEELASCSCFMLGHQRCEQEGKDR